MSQPIENFSPHKFVKGLPSDQLEVLSEFQDEAASILALLTHSGKKYRAPNVRQMIQVFLAAESELASRIAVPYEPVPLDDQPPAWRFEPTEPTHGDEVEQPTPNQGGAPQIPRNGDSEWKRELAGEIRESRTGLALPTMVTIQEIRAIFQATKDHPRNHLIVRVLYASGIRREELVHLKVADIYFERNVLFIRRGKYDKDRYVLIDQETTDHLRTYTKDKLLTDQVFDISTRTVNRIVNEAAEQAGVRQRMQAIGRTFTPHSLRHAYATHMYESGADLFILKTLLGHVFLKVTKTYVHLAMNSLVERYQRHHPLASGSFNDQTPTTDYPLYLKEEEEERGDD